MLFFSGLIGFLGGFAVGLYILRYLLRGKKSEELVQNKSLWWKYGPIVWLCAFVGSYVCLVVYQNYLL